MSLCFNPCYDGRSFWLKTGTHYTLQGLVSILVMMEGHFDLKPGPGILWQIRCFNPCYDGRSFWLWGSYTSLASQSFQSLLWWKVILTWLAQRLPWQAIRFNPCYDGRSFWLLFPVVEYPWRSVSILVMMEGHFDTRIPNNWFWDNWFQSLLWWKVILTLWSFWKSISLVSFNPCYDGRSFWPCVWS